jgi:uncharacterized delta-60 repeat protein
MLALRTSARARHGGHYSVLVSNALGTVWSEPARLTVDRVAARPGGPDLNYYSGTGPDKRVTCLAIDRDSRVLIGGHFNSVDGLARTRLARLLEDGAVDASFQPPGPLSNGWVNTVAVRNDGRVWVGGAFYGDGPLGRVHAIARLLPNGTLDTTFNRSGFTSGAAEALVPLADGGALAGGQFQLVSWPYAAGVIRLDAGGLVLTQFICRINLDGTVYGLAAQADGKFVMGGDFYEVNGVFRKGVARLDTNGVVDLTFDPGAGANSPIRAVVVQPDGRLLLAGSFSRFAGRPYNRLARLNPDGSRDASFEPGLGADHAVYALALQTDGKTLVAGSFNDIGGMRVSGITRLNADGSLDLTYETQPGADGTVQAVALLPHGAACIAGDFGRVGGVARSRVARLLPAAADAGAPKILAGPESLVVKSGADAYFGVLASGQPAPSYQWQLNHADLPAAERWFLRLPNVRVTNAGSYSVNVRNARGSVASGLAFLWVTPPSRSAGAPDIDFYSGLGPSDAVRSVFVQPDRRLLIAGAFTEVNGVQTPHLARLLPDGRVDASFVSALRPNDQLRAAALQTDGKVLAGGVLVRSNTSPLVVRLHADG